MSVKRRVLLVAGAFAAALALVVAIVPTGTAAATVDWSPGIVVGIDDATIISVNVQNESDKEISVTYGVIQAQGISTGLDETATVSGNATGSKSYMCASALGCSITPIVTTPKKNVLVWGNFVRSGIKISIFTGDWRSV